MIHRCARCDSPATFHLTDIKNGTKTERHLCEECAKALQVPQAKKELQNLLKSFDPAHAMTRSRPSSKGSRVCPDCGISYVEFRQNGRFGCARDYDIFAKEVTALLERIHGSAVYSGKTPDGGQIIDGVLVDEVTEVRARLAAAIEKEDYEQAARLRDEIRRMSTSPSPGPSPGTGPSPGPGPGASASTPGSGGRAGGPGRPDAGGASSGAAETH